MKQPPERISNGGSSITNARSASLTYKLFVSYLIENLSLRLWLPKVTLLFPLFVVPNTDLIIIAQLTGACCYRLRYLLFADIFIINGKGKHSASKFMLQNF
jgi:hypothetical protein